MREFVNEYRLGNLIESDGAIYTVGAISQHGISIGECVRKATGMRTNGGQKHPIKITPEILQKCGFDKKVNIQQIDGIEMTLQVRGDGRDGTWFSSCGTMNGGIVVLCLCRGNYFSNNIEYLHQLQNLFFALTGLELNVSL